MRCGSPRSCAALLLLGGAATNGIGLRPRPGEGEVTAAKAPGPADAAGIG